MPLLLDDAAQISPNTDELFAALEAWYDAYMNGTQADIIANEEALASAWEYLNGRPVPCGICHKYECSHNDA